MSCSSLVTNVITDCVESKGFRLIPENAERLAKLAAMLDMMQFDGVIDGGQVRADVDPSSGSVAISTQDCGFELSNYSVVTAKEFFETPDRVTFGCVDKKEGVYTLTLTISNVFYLEE